MQRPSIGRIVRFVTEDLQMAAIITAVHPSNQVDLTIFYPPRTTIAAIPEGPFPLDDSGKKLHSWHWAERTAGVETIS